MQGRRFSAEKKCEANQVVLRTTENRCKRCLYFGNDNDAEVDAVSTFYCDVGIKSVLRRIRRHCIERIDFNFDCKDLTRKQQVLEKACCDFYKQHVRGRGNTRAKASANDIMELMQVFIDLREIPSKDEGATKRKRDAKANHKKRLTRPNIIFSNFNREFLDCLAANPLTTAFRRYLKPLQISLLVNYEEGLQTCRAKSFAQILRWL